jgi:orotate phosphoribosyltransferase
MIPDNEAEPTMTREEVLQHYRESGALLEGHFLLTSGLHSPVYMQSARVLMHPERSPAMGGVVVGYELARQLGVPSIFTERVEGVFALRRGFEIPQGARVLMAEDVVTTGKSSRECIECIEANGGKVVAASCIVDRSDGEVQLGVPLFTLCGFKVPSYREDELPPELRKLPAVKPGSRGLK